MSYVSDPSTGISSNHASLIRQESNISSNFSNSEGSYVDDLRESFGTRGYSDKYQESSSVSRKSLISEGSDSGKRSRKRRSVLNSSQSGLIAYHGINVNMAASQGNLPIVVLLWGMAAAKHISLMSYDEAGNSPYHHAALADNSEVLSFISQQTRGLFPGTDVRLVDTKNVAGETALLRAIGTGKISVVKYLLDEGSNVFVRDYDGNTIFTACVKHRHIWCLHYLYSSISTKLGEATARTLLCMCDSHGNSTLDYAAASGDINIMEYLIRRGLSPYRINKQHRNALYWAAAHHHIPMISYLRKIGCDMMICDIYGVSSYIIAASYDDHEMMLAMHQRSYYEPDTSSIHDHHQVSKYISSDDVPMHMMLVRQDTADTVISALHDDRPSLSSSSSAPSSHRPSMISSSSSTKLSPSSSSSSLNRPSSMKLSPASSYDHASTTVGSLSTRTISMNDNISSYPTVSSLGNDSTMISSSSASSLSDHHQEHHQDHHDDMPASSSTIIEDHVSSSAIIIDDPHHHHHNPHHQHDSHHDDHHDIIHPPLYHTSWWGSKHSHAIQRIEPTRPSHLLMHTLIMFVLYGSAMLLPFYIWIVMIVAFLVAYRHVEAKAQAKHQLSSVSASNHILSPHKFSIADHPHHHASYLHRLIIARERYLGTYTSSYLICGLYLMLCIISIIYDDHSINTSSYSIISSHYIHINAVNVYHHHSILFIAVMICYVASFVSWVMLVAIIDPGIVDTRYHDYDDAMDHSMIMLGLSSSSSSSSSPPSSGSSSSSSLPLPSSSSSSSYCHSTLVKKPVRSKYCRSSGYVVARMDHYCMWLNVAIGYGNHRVFMIFLYAHMMFAALFVSMLMIALHENIGHHNVYDIIISLLSAEYFFVLLITIHMVAFLFAISMLAYEQTNNILHNMTTNERINHARYAYITTREDGKLSTRFDRGSYLMNCMEFWHLCGYGVDYHHTYDIPASSSSSSSPSSSSSSAVELTASTGFGIPSSSSSSSSAKMNKRKSKSYDDADQHHINIHDDTINMHDKSIITGQDYV